MSRRVHKEGEHFSLLDLLQWSSFATVRGDIVAFDLRDSSHPTDSSQWVAFMVIQVQLNRADGSLTVEAKSLGGENVALSKELSQQFNRKRGRLHFCASDPCLHEDLGDIHVRSFNWYSLEGYAEHLTVSALRSARKWAETPREAGLEEVRDSEDETHPGSTAEHGGDPGPVPEELAGDEAPPRAGQFVAGGTEARQGGDKGAGPQQLMDPSTRKRKTQERRRLVCRGKRRRVTLVATERQGEEEQEQAQEDQGQREGATRQWPEGGRQVMSPLRALELADAGLIASFTTDTIQMGLEVFTQALLNTSTLGSLGCSIAWLLVHVEASERHVFTRALRQIIFESCKMSQVGPRRGSIFPIPLGKLEGFKGVVMASRLSQVQEPGFAERWQVEAWLFCALAGLNGVSGSLQPLAPGPTTKVQGRAVASLTRTVERFLHLGGCHHGELERIRQELKGVRLSYTGEELSICHPLTREQVLPALPPGNHGGSVDVLDLVSHGTRRLLEHPELLVIEDSGQDLPPLQAKVHCTHEEMVHLGRDLVDRNICAWIPLEEVFAFRGQPVLSGLFGVEKSSKLSDGRSTLRLIMNLIPINSLMNPIVGSVRKLPSITSWLGITTDPDESLGLYQSDMASAFYLFKLPAAWHKYLAFNVRVRGSVIGLNDDRVHVLCCNVLPMGWVSSVAVTQEVAESVAFLPLLGRLRPAEFCTRLALVARVLRQFLRRPEETPRREDRSWPGTS